MAYRNYIDLNDDAQNKPVYRIMPIHRFLETLEKKQLVLVHPKKWDDPFENALLSAQIKTADGQIGAFAAKDYIYGQCWTTQKETDAMWRIYSPDKQGIKVKTTPKRLLDALVATNPDYWELRCFIGKVTYLYQTELLEKLQKVDWRNTDGSGTAETLLYKRKEFSHEHEVRLIYCADQNNSKKSDVHPFEILPNEMFDEVVFDPRMNTELVQAYKLAISAKGFTNKISQSALYQPPKGLVINI